VVPRYSTHRQEGDIVSVVAVLAILVCIPALRLLHPSLVRPLDRRLDRTGFGPTALVCVLGALLWLGISAAVPELAGSSLRWPVGALAALAVYLCSVAVRVIRARTVVLALFCGVWCALVFVPAAALVFFPEVFGFTISSSAWDLGGAVPVHVAGGAAVLAVIRVHARRDARAAYPTADRPPHRVLVGQGHPAVVLASAGLVLWAGWVAALVGLDMAIDSVTPLIVRNGIIVPLASMAGWLLLERVRTRRTTLFSAAGGLVSGLVAITPAGGSLGVAWALTLGLVVGLVCSACALERDVNSRDADGHDGGERDVGGTLRPGRYLVAVHLLAAVIGLLWVGLFGDGGGFVYTGQFSTVQVQLAVSVVVAVWSYIVATWLSALLRLRHPPR
jgi:Amt family ammonium transporter